MWLKNACVIKKIPINNAAAAGSDPNVAGFIEKATQTLGKKGRFVIKLSGIPQENSVLAEGKSERLCNHCIEEFEKLLIKKGYLDHEHVWEILQETDYGEMDYNSYGGGVEHFVVTLYRCRLCGALHKECRGDFCGDPREYLEKAPNEGSRPNRSIHFLCVFSAIPLLISAYPPIWFSILPYINQ